MQECEIRTIRDHEGGIVEVRVYQRPPSGLSGVEYDFFTGEEPSRPTLVFGAADVMLAGQWGHLTPADRHFAMLRLGMSYLSQKTLWRSDPVTTHRFVLHTQSGSWLDAVEKTDEGLRFHDFTEDEVDSRVRDDILFAMKQAGYTQEKRVPIREFPWQLVSNFWTPEEIDRNIRDLDKDGLLGVQSLHGRVEHGVAHRPIEALGLTRDGEKQARRLVPPTRVLFQTAEEREKDRQNIHAALAGDELAQAEQLLEFESSIPEVLLRAAGVIAGVVLERHLRCAVEQRNQSLAEHERYPFGKSKDGIRAYANWLIGQGLVGKSERNHLEN